MSARDQARDVLHDMKVRDECRAEVNSATGGLFVMVLVLFMLYSLLDHPNWPAHLWRYLFK